MSRVDLVRRSFAYDQWANHQILDSLGDLPLIHDLIGTWSHLVLVRQLWVKRVCGEEYNQLNLWTVLTIPESSEMLKETDRRWEHFLADLDKAALDELVHFTDSQGKPQSDPLEEVLMHVTHHCAYLRGQLSVKVRATGIQPPTLDPIRWLRQARSAAPAHHHHG
jgi:uncharacterized damage-inducible protein DinB